MEQHNIQPIFNSQSKILVLGSFPSVKSREGQFFYDHPANRFWKVLGGVLEQEVPRTHNEKRSFLLENGIALWDVLSSCDITGSSDASIRHCSPNDLTLIMNTADIQAIFCNGATAFRYFEQFDAGNISLNAVKLPSTSPANAAFSLQKLIDQWRVIAAYL